LKRTFSEIQCTRIGRSRSSKVDDFATRNRVFDFLLVIQSNLEDENTVSVNYYTVNSKQ